MEKEIVVQIGWVRRLSFYTGRVTKTASDDADGMVSHKMALIALLGYLDSLEHLVGKDGV